MMAGVRNRVKPEATGLICYPAVKGTLMDRPRKKHGSPQSLNAAVKSICDIMRRSNCAGALQYVPELTWILFLRILDERETREVEEAAALGVPFTATLVVPFRWQDWAAPKSPMREDKNASVWKFVHEQLLPELKALKNKAGATSRQKVVSEIMSGVDRSRIDSEKNFLDVLDKVHEISSDNVDQTHVFTLSQVYEGLLLKMGERGNDGGQFFTPREVIRAMVRVVDPQIGKTVYDPGCGTGGFLAQSYEYMRDKAGDKISAVELDTLKHRTFYGREKDNVVYPIGLANLVLHGIDDPHVWHGNSLSEIPTYAGLFDGAPKFFDYVLMNPPFGGKEGKEAQIPYEYKTGATQVLFIQNVLRSMKAGSRCGIVLDEGVLFRVDAEAFVQTKRKLLEECDVYCLVSLPGGVFSSAGAGVKTNLVFFDKGKQTERIWYYDLSDMKVGKKTPLTLAHFEEFFQLLPERVDSERSWTIDFSTRLQSALAEAQPFRERAAEFNALANRLDDELVALRKKDPLPREEIEKAKLRWKEALREGREADAKAATIENAVYDLKAVNPHRIVEEDTRTPLEIIQTIEEKDKEATAALSRLQELLVGDNSSSD
jgi:type I restriction enzyme M protein